MVCGYLTAQMILTTLCVIWKVTDTTMEHYYDKGLLEWLDHGLAPPRPRIVLDKQSGPEQRDIWKLAVSTEQLGSWMGHFTGTSRSHSNYFFHYSQSYFIQACVPLPFVTIIFAVYHCLYAKIVKTKQTQLVKTLFTNIINKGELSGNT